MALVAGIQQESKHITDLQQENRELRNALEEQQNAVDLIMSKYREHVSKLLECQRLDQQLLDTIDTNNKVCVDAKIIYS
jgi:cell shape-determining protein MreC